MKVQISEVWNAEGRSVPLVTIDVWSAGSVHETHREALQAVLDWVANNRPDLKLANTINAHGYHAKEVQA